MTKREKEIMKIAVEIDGLLTNGIEVQPNSNVHEKLKQALRKTISRKPKKGSKKVVTSEWLSNWFDVIKRI
jgi:hypothetical protein